MMVRALKTSFAWQFVGGFLLGTVGLVALQPERVSHNLGSHLSAPIAATR